MKRTTTLCFAFMAALFFTTSLFALTGRDIVEKSDALPKPKSVWASVEMIIYSGGRPIIKKFERSAKYQKNGEKTLISFTFPSVQKLLTHSNGGKDQQWLRLTSGRVKKIGARDAEKSFADSHFCYGDFLPRPIDDYTYRLIGEAQAAGADCYKVEAVKKQGMTGVYDKSVLYMRKSDFYMVRMDLYRKGRLEKFLENHDVKKLNGKYLTAFKVVMTMADGRVKTILKLERDPTYNKTIPDRTFDEKALR